MTSIQQEDPLKNCGRSPRKLSRTTRAILADVPTNVAAQPTCKASLDMKQNAEAPRRRSERLSTAREETKQGWNVIPIDMKTEHLQAKRGRSKSLAVRKEARETSCEGESTKEKKLLDRPGKRVRMPRKHSPLPETTISVRAASRRLDEEFDDFPPPSKQARLMKERRKDETTYQQEHHNLPLTNFEPTKYTSGLSPYDITNRGDVLQSPEYVSDIFQRLYQSETITAPTCYMHHQQYISPLMRAILVDWIVDIHLEFRCAPETLHLAINIIDRYLTNVKIKRDIIQLVGITALLLASKYEDIYPPEVKNCVRICEPSYSVQQVLDMEADMLGALSYNLTVPTGYPFLQRFLFITQATETMTIAANYYSERMLQEHDALQFRPSVIAAASVCLAINHPEIRFFDCLDVPKPGVPQELLDYTGYSQELILKAANFVATKVSESMRTKANRALEAVHRKYGSRRYRHVSTNFESPDAVDILDDME